jgi:hypothetical protein
MYRLLLTLFLVAYGQAIFHSTFATYNGSLGYTGLWTACQKEWPRSHPCTPVDLNEFFWKTPLLPSWTMQPDRNCVGYSTNSTLVFGPCVISGVIYGNTSITQLTECTCDMKISVCCAE